MDTIQRVEELKLDIQFAKEKATKDIKELLFEAIAQAHDRRDEQVKIVSHVAYMIAAVQREIPGPSSISFNVSFDNNQIDFHFYKGMENKSSFHKMSLIPKHIDDSILELVEFIDHNLKEVLK